MKFDSLPSAARDVLALHDVLINADRRARDMREMVGAAQAIKKAVVSGGAGGLSTAIRGIQAFVLLVRALHAMAPPNATPRRINRRRRPRYGAG